MINEIINSERGKIAIRYHHSRLPKPPIAVVLLPKDVNSVYMKLSQKIISLLIESGFSVVEMDFNKNSQNLSSARVANKHAILEIQDVSVTIDWLHGLSNGTNVYWVIGLEFGAFIGMHVTMRRPEVERFVFVSLPTSREYDYNFIIPNSAFGLVIRGKNDKISKEAKVLDVIEELKSNNEPEIEYTTVEDKNDAIFIKECADSIAKYIGANLKKDMGRVRVVRRDRRRRSKKKLSESSEVISHISPIKNISLDDL